MIRFNRSDRLAGMHTAYSYFGGSSHDDAPVCLGEYSVDKFYLSWEDRISFSQQPDGSWEKDSWSDTPTQKFDSLVDLLAALGLELFLETGERVEDPKQAKAPLSKNLLDSFPKKQIIQSFDEFNVIRHGLGDV